MTDTTARGLRDPARLAALHDLALLDTPLEASFERLTHLVTRILGVPISLITLIDADRQFFKSCVGLPEPYATERETALSHSFCQYIVSEQQPLVVSDARAHPLLHANLALSDLGVVAYAGVPLTTAEGYVIGALCAIDHQPRTWRADDLANLTDLAALVMTEIKLRSDIIERQRFEVVLHESEQFLRSIYDGVTETIFVSDVALDGTVRCISVNPAYERNTGLASAEMIGKTADDIFPPEVAALVNGGYRTCIARGVPYTYEQCLPFQGQDSWWLTTLHPLRDATERVYRIVGTSINMTEHKRAKDALHESEQFLRSIYDGVAESIFVLDVLPDGAIRNASINAAHERVMKTTSAEIQGKTPHDLFVPEVADQIMARFQECITAGATITYEESVPFRGEQTWWMTKLNPLIDRSGRTFRIIGTSINITSRKNAEDALRVSQHKLLELQKYESMGVMAGGVAHDFNNLLAAMLGNVELAMLELPPASPALPFLRQTDATARRAADLTRQMLAYAGQVSVLPQRLNLNSLVAEMTHLLHVTIPKQTQLQCDFTIVPPVEADPTQIRQVVMNLVLNAAEAIADRPGHIVVTTAMIEVDARYLSDTYLSYDVTPGSYVALVVADDGIGIDAATQARMFDPFFTTKQNGHGLGLAAVLGIVRRHNGALRVESAPGQGARFTVLLPVVSSWLVAPPEQSSTEGQMYTANTHLAAAKILTAQSVISVTEPG